MTERLTQLQADERAAMLGDRAATLRVVSGLRRYRALVERLLGARYGDGAVDGYEAAAAETEIEAIEAGEVSRVA